VALGVVKHNPQNPKTPNPWEMRFVSLNLTNVLPTFMF
jgi:hypothetical protein